MEAFVKTFSGILYMVNIETKKVVSSAVFRSLPSRKVGAFFEVVFI